MSISLGDSDVPVGLFGEHSSTIEGCSRSINSSAAGRSSTKSPSRRPVTHRVCVSRAYSGYIEYVGANDTAVRPGPPKACISCNMISFEPFAAHTSSTPRPGAPSPLR